MALLQGLADWHTNWNAVVYFNHMISIAMLIVIWHDHKPAFRGDATATSEWSVNVFSIIIVYNYQMTGRNVTVVVDMSAVGIEVGKNISSEYWKLFFSTGVLYIA